MGACCGADDIKQAGRPRVQRAAAKVSIVEKRSKADAASPFTSSKPITPTPRVGNLRDSYRGDYMDGFHTSIKVRDDDVDDTMEKGIFEVRRKVVQKKNKGGDETVTTEPNQNAKLKTFVGPIA